MMQVLLNLFHALFPDGIPLLTKAILLRIYHDWERRSIELQGKKLSMRALSAPEEKDLHRLLRLKAHQVLSPDELHLLTDLLQKLKIQPKLAEVDEVFLQSFTNSSALLQEMIQHASDTPCPIDSLLTRCKSAPKSELLNAWISQLEKAFIFEPSPLRVLTCLPPYQTPLQFAGVLLYLLRRQIPIQELICSGLLHNFFAQFANEKDKISEAYALLRASSPEEPCFESLQVFLKEISTIRGFVEAKGIERAILNHWALDGTQQDRALEGIVIQLPKACHSPRSYQNLKNLYAFYGQDFIVYVLKEGVLRTAEPPLETFLHDIFDKSGIEPLIELYQKILSQRLHNDEKVRILKSLAIPLTSEALYRLFKNSPELRWTLIISKFIKISPQEWVELINQPLMPHDLAYFPKCFEDNPLLYEYEREIFRHMFNLFLNNPELMDIEETEDGLSALTSYKEINEWVKLEARCMRDRLREQVIHNFPITHDTYQNIRDNDNENQARFRVLRALGMEKAYDAYPSDVYQLQKLILSIGVERTEHPFDLENYLQIFNHSYEYNAEELVQATVRTLSSCMKDKALSKLHPFIMSYLFSKLPEFQTFIWQLLTHQRNACTDEQLQHLLASPLQPKSLEYLYGSICKKDSWLEALIESLKPDYQIKLWQVIIRSALDNRLELNPLVNFCRSTSRRLLTDILVPKNSISRDSLAYELVVAGQFKPLASFYALQNDLLGFLGLTNDNGESILQAAMQTYFHTWTAHLGATSSLDLSDVFHRSISKPKEYRALLEAIPCSINELWVGQGLFELSCTDLFDILTNLPKTITTIGVLGRVANNRNEIQEVVRQLCAIKFDKCVRTIGAMHKITTPQLMRDLTELGIESCYGDFHHHQSIDSHISSRFCNDLRDLKTNLLIDFTGTKNDCGARCNALIQHADEETGDFCFKKITIRLVEVLETFASPHRKRARLGFFSEEPQAKVACLGPIADLKHLPRFPL